MAFKVGDRVRVTQLSDFQKEEEYYINQKGTLSSISYKSEFPYIITFDRTDLPEEQLGFVLGEFELLNNPFKLWE